MLALGAPCYAASASDLQDPATAQLLSPMRTNSYASSAASTYSYLEEQDNSMVCLSLFRAQQWPVEAGSEAGIPHLVEANPKGDHKWSGWTSHNKGLVPVSREKAYFTFMQAGEAKPYLKRNFAVLSNKKGDIKMPLEVVQKSLREFKLIQDHEKLQAVVPIFYDDKDQPYSLDPPFGYGKGEKARTSRKELHRLRGLACIFYDSTQVEGGALYEWLKDENYDEQKKFVNTYLLEPMQVSAHAEGADDGVHAPAKPSKPTPAAQGCHDSPTHAAEEYYIILTKRSDAGQPAQANPLGKKDDLRDQGAATSPAGASRAAIPAIAALAALCSSLYFFGLRGRKHKALKASKAASKHRGGLQRRQVAIAA